MSNLDELTQNELTLNNVLANPGILQKMTTRGFDQQKTESGLGLLSTARADEEAYLARLGAQKQATAEVKSALNSALKTFVDFRETARGAFVSEQANPSAWTALRLKGRVPLGQVELVAQALSSFNAALADPEILAALKPWGYTDESLEAARKVIESAASSNQAQEAAKGARDAGKVTRDASFSAARQFMSGFKRVARRALTPDELKAIGL